jgi:two-component system nitrogen regulation response regulator NtrX
MKAGSSMSNHQKILIIDDDQSICQTYKRILDRHGYHTIDATTGKQGLQLFSTDVYDLVLLDLQLPDSDGLEIAKSMTTEKPGVPIVVISAHGNVQKAVVAAKLGAYDFLEKPLDRERLLICIRNALAQRALELQISSLQTESHAKFRMIGNSPAMQQVYELIERIAPTHSPVLILGENGVGKELVAQAIHQQSAANHQKMIKINCSAIPETLIESELFGHTKGAFTGAHTAKKGRFEMAHGSTLFLDEIGELAPELQAKLLRFLESGELQRVGSTEITMVNVRVIAATNQNIQEQIAAKHFRMDLFYRLNTFTIHVPPLRERPEDIPQLTEYFLNHFVDEYGWAKPQITPAGMNVLKGFHWPGNVRQLQNFINKLMLLRRDDVVDLDEIKRLLLDSKAPCVSIPEEILPLNIARYQFEYQYITRALQEKNWRITCVAKLLNIDRAYLYRKMKQLGISPHKPD